MDYHVACILDRGGHGSLRVPISRFSFLVDHPQYKARLESLLYRDGQVPVSVGKFGDNWIELTQWRDRRVFQMRQYPWVLDREKVRKVCLGLLDRGCGEGYASEAYFRWAAMFAVGQREREIVCIGWLLSMAFLGGRSMMRYVRDAYWNFMGTLSAELCCSNGANVFRAHAVYLSGKVAADRRWSRVVDMILLTVEQYFGPRGWVGAPVCFGHDRCPHVPALAPVSGSEEYVEMEMRLGEKKFQCRLEYLQAIDRGSGLDGGGGIGGGLRVDGKPIPGSKSNLLNARQATGGALYATEADWLVDYPGGIGSGADAARRDIYGWPESVARGGEVVDAQAPSGDEFEDFNPSSPSGSDSSWFCDACNAGRSDFTGGFPPMCNCSS